MTGDDRKLIDELAAVHLAGVINHIAESFDVAALSPAEAVAAYTLVDRLTSALWQEHKRVLVPSVAHSPRDRGRAGRAR